MKLPFLKKNTSIPPVPLIAVVLFILSLPLIVLEIQRQQTTQSDAAVQVGHLGGQVWNDCDSDGRVDAGEAGISGVTVRASGPITKTGVTSGSGSYYIQYLNFGTYLVSVQIPAGYSATTLPSLGVNVNTSNQYASFGLRGPGCSTSTPSGGGSGGNTGGNTGGSGSQPTIAPKPPTGGSNTSPQQSTNADLVVSDVKLTNSSGQVKTVFQPNEQIFVLYTIKNQGTSPALNQYASTGNIWSHVYSNKPQSVAAATNSDVGMYTRNKNNIQPNESVQYGSYPNGPSQGTFEGSKSWTKTTPGSYTARVYVNFDGLAKETSYTNNQRTLTYTVAAPTPTRTPTKAPTNTPTKTPTPTKLPTSTPTRTPTPTTVIAQIPTNTPTTIPTTPPSDTEVILTLFLGGIGRGGDLTAPNSLGNQNPKRLTRNVILEVYGADGGAPLMTLPVPVTYNSQIGAFQGRRSLGILPTDNYILKVRTIPYLRRQIGNFSTLTTGQTVTLPEATLIAGDVNQDNIINIVDYSLILDCYSDVGPARNCNAEKKLSADLNDDGNVNQFDYNLLIRNLSVQLGQ